MVRSNNAYVDTMLLTCQVSIEFKSNPFVLDLGEFKVTYAHFPMQFH